MRLSGNGLIATTLAFLIVAAAGTARADFEYVGGFGYPGTAAGQFSEIRGVAVESGGKIVTSESGTSRIQVCTELGVCSTFGSLGVLTGEFDKPREIEVDLSSNEIVIADRGNDRMQFCTTWGSCDSVGGSGTGLGQFESPRGIAVLSSTQVAVADTENNRIQICNRQGTCSAFGSLGGSPGQFDGPAGIAVNSQGRIIVADRLNNRIQVCTTGGSCTAFGSTGSGLGQFNEPTGVAVDSQDRIIVADHLNHRIQVCSSQGSCTAFGSFGSAAGQLKSPWGVAVGAGDRIIVADAGNERVQIFAEAAPSEPVVIDSFTASQSAIDAGDSVTLTWAVSNADSCTPSGGTGGWSSKTINPAGGSTSITVNTAGSYSFTLECSGGGETDSASVVVTATDPTPPPPAFQINTGITDAWYYPVTNGQGFFIIVWEDIQTVFLSWFTYDVERPADDVTALLGEPGHRWITAQGPYSGDTATLTVSVTSGGVFDAGEPPVETVPAGTMEVQFSSCNEGMVTYEIDSLGLTGAVPIQRIVLDNVPLCEALNQ